MSEAALRLPNEEEQEADCYVFPASFAQRRLWFLDRLSGPSASYNISSAVRLRGPLDRRALERALQELVRRHESLRTSFLEEEGVPQQAIHEEASAPLRFDDLRRSRDPESEAAQLLDEEASAAFDLTHAPLLRARLVQLGDEDHAISLVLHHIISDGWSSAVLVRELKALYAAFSAGQPSPLPELELQYADFSEWQSEYLQGQRLQDLLEYWRECLDASAAPLELPADRIRPKALSSGGAGSSFQLTAELSQSLRDLGRRRGATLFMVLMTAYDVLLHRLSGDRDLSVGTPVANRTRPELEGLIGFFVNTLVIRCAVDGEESFADLLNQVREKVSGALAHQELPFERLVEELSPERRRGLNPLFQVGFVLQNTPRESLGDGAELMETRQSSSRFDLTLSLNDNGTLIRGNFEFKTDLFSPETIRRWTGYYCTILEAAVENDGAAVGRIRLQNDQELVKVLQDWNRTQRCYPESSLQDVFSRQAKRTPDKHAALCGHQRITYDELERRSNQLANWLIGQGAGPESRVGVCLDRSPLVPVALLGILKAGGAYVAFDPDYPAQRLSFIAQDSSLLLTLTESRLESRLPDALGRRIALDSAWDPIGEKSEDPPALSSSPDSLAYVTYTSGTTGNPKGVEISHRNVLRLLFGADYAPLEEGRTILQSASLPFDASTFEIWGALLHGGCCALLSERVPTAQGLRRSIEEHGIEIAWLTSSLFNAVVDQDPSALAGLDRLLAGGEALSRQHVLRAQTALPQVGLVNGYGPTETTTFACCWPIPDPLPEDRLVAIGSPVSNARTYIVDRHLNPSPIGVNGELCIAGDGLARGYQHQPRLTAERFIPCPFALHPGERMYRSGDLTRWRVDGRIEFLGRIDRQIKLRGFRIEPGEIESALSSHPQVDQAAVLLDRDAQGEKRLIAYAACPDSPQEGRPALSQELHASLKQSLPEYMLPAIIVILERMPVTAQGKLDRGALPAIDEERIRSLHSFVAPRNAEERQLAKIWSGILGLDRIGVGDDFFRIGGHSLSATQVVSRISKEFGIEVPLADLFDDPTIEGLARSIAQAQGLARKALPEIERLTRREDAEGNVRFPASFAQRRLWFIDRLTQGEANYNVFQAVRLLGPLDLPALQSCLDAIAERHESLRTFFCDEDGQPIQAVQPKSRIALEFFDLKGSEQPEIEARRLAVRESRCGFRLDRAPLLRLGVLRLAPEHHVALLNMHHIISDGWSMGVLIREIAEGYAAFRQGQAPAFEPLPVQYADFSLWQQEWLEGGELARQTEYWKQQLGTDVEPLQLPSDKRRPDSLSYRGADHPIRLGPELAAELKKLGDDQGATLFMTLLTGYFAFLHRYSGQRNLRVGSPVANRRRPELEGLIGFFVNTLVLSAEVSPQLTALELLSQVRERTLGAFDHQDVPFERLVETLSPQRDPSRSPLFQAMLALQNAPAERMQASDLEVQAFESESGTARFDLTLSLAEAGGELRGVLQYSTDLFEGPTIERMTRHLKRLLEGICRNPQLPIGRLSMLDEAERRRILEDWNRVGHGVANDSCVHDLFRQQAERSPDAPAAIFQDSAISYRQLERESNRLARYLAALGAQPETRVAVFLERSAEMVAAVWGILKSGAAYVPLDPSYPADRITMMLQDCQATLVITRKELSPRLATASALVVCLDEHAERISACSPERVRSSAQPDNTAYMIYTSGSTGRPKAVMVSHRNLCHSTLSRLQMYEAAPRRFLLLPSLAFDSSVAGFYWTLLSGGALVLPCDGFQFDIAGLRQLIQRHRVTHLLCLPSLYQVMLEEGNRNELKSLQTAIVAGEACPGELPSRHFELSKARFYNEYGPTEGTVWCSLYESPEGRQERSPLTIGGPIAGSQLYILDPNLEPTPLGVPGQLFIGGPGVTRGYLDRPALTASRFLPDPFLDRPGSRLYASGDLARWLPQGEIEFLGRVDHQVKIRGYRVELGEIEAVLRQHPRVREAALAASESGGATRLAAYVVAEGELNPEDLKGFLGSRLPDYMTPSAIVQLEKLPLAPNGKVDRKALPEPAPRQLSESSPRTQTQQLVADIWSQLLGLDAVGLEESFFGLGGHSLMATRVVSRLEKAFGIDIPIETLFRAPTVKGLAAELEAILGSGETSQAPPLTRRQQQGPAPLSFPQQRLWFLEQVESSKGAYHIPSALRIAGPLDAGALERSLAELVRRHESLRTAFRAGKDGTPRQEIVEDIEFRLALLDLASAQVEDEELLRVVAEEAAAPFDLTQPPLLRALLMRLASDDHVLVLTMHHIVSDGWSMGVLVEEMTALYEAFGQGRPDGLPALPLQYPDYAQWQREWLSGKELERQLTYWRETLQGIEDNVELPIDRPRPPVQSFEGDTVEFDIPQETSELAKQVSRLQGATLFMTLLAAFQTLLHRISGCSDVTTGVPVAGRQRPEVEGLIGFFVNTLVLRSRSNGSESFRDRIEQARKAALGALSHQDLPFEKLVEELSPQRDASRSPLFQTMFALQNAPGKSLESAGLEFRSLQSQRSLSLFDLSLIISETDSGLKGVLEYSTCLFERESAQGIVERFLTLLDAALRNPNGAVGDLPLMSEAEKRRTLEEWNRSQRAFPRELPIQALIEEQARRDPQALALIDGRVQLTFAELDLRASRLARRLRASGLEVGDRACICLERSPEMVTALLAVLKCGAAYVPLDPAYPPERLNFMIEDSGPKILITRERYSRIPSQFEGLRILVDDPRQPDVESLEQVRLPEVGSHLPAYLIYTSGTTGRPKGVLVAHRSIVNVCHQLIDRYAMAPGERALQFVSFSFDVHAEEIFPALFAGAAVVLRDDAMLASSADFVDAVRRLRLTRLDLPPAFWHQLITDLNSSGDKLPECVGSVVVGSEKVALQDYVAWQQLTEDRPVTLMNVYGPTETTIISTCNQVGHGLPRRERVMLSVGRPVANTQIYLMDKRLQPVPQGVAGEVCIGGEGVTFGYWRRPALTAERFLPDPFAERPGLRLYRTGDLGRYLPSGDLELLGRIDKQIKIRGFRVEPGEIEAEMERHPDVRKCLVLAEDLKDGRQVGLIAYSISDRQRPSAYWKDYLRQRLPEHMIPGAFVSVDEFPLSPTGKIDRRALPRPSQEASAKPYAAPSSEAERSIARIWQQALGREQVGAEDNFFDLGGHSLLLMQVHAQLQSHFEKDFTVVDLFRFTTVRSLARYLSDHPQNSPQEASAEQAYQRGSARRAAARRRRSA